MAIQTEPTRVAPHGPKAPPRAAGSPFAAMIPGVFVIMWSSAFVAGLIGVDAAPPLLLTFARFGLAGLLLAGFALVVRAPWPRGRTLAHVAVTGLLIQAVQFGAMYTALGQGMPAAVIALVQGLNPVVIALLATPLLGERVTRRQALGFALGAAGVVLAVADRVSLSPAGVVLCVIGLLALSLGTVYQKHHVSDMNVLTGTTVQLLVAAPVVGLGSLLLETPRVSSWVPFSATLAWLVVVNSIGALLLLNTLLRRSSASRVSTLFFLTPSVTALMAFAVAGQALHPLALVGLVVGGTGVLLANQRR